MKTEKRSRLGRVDWLDRAADVIAEEGGVNSTIDELCAKLGVTKGSFYAHFANRQDFVEQFVQRWSERSTQAVIDQIDSLKAKPAEARLLDLMRYLRKLPTKGLEVALRAWATHDPVVAAGVQTTDELRYRYIRRIFQEMGFRGADLELRTRLFVGYHVGEMVLRLPPSRFSKEQELKGRHALFCR